MSARNSALCTFLVTVLGSGWARAWEGDSPALAPVAMTSLAPASHEPRFDLVQGLLRPRDPNRPVAGALVVRPSVVTNMFVKDHLYLTANMSIARAMPPDGGRTPTDRFPEEGPHTLLGNLELTATAVFPLPSWLECGLSFGTVLPTATFDRDDRAARSAALAAASLEPTSLPQYLPQRLTLRPSGELRFIRGRFTFQGKHGIDVAIDTAGREHAKLAGQLMAHVGYMLSPRAEVSIEAAQSYLFARESVDTPGSFGERYRVQDGRRSAIIVGPAVRWSVGTWELGAALVTNVLEPASPAADQVVGLRLSIVGKVAHHTRPGAAAPGR